MQAVPRIAIADDDVDMRQWLQVALRPLGADVQEAADGSDLLDVLAAAEEHPFDLVIADVFMPMPSGSNVVAMVRTAGFTTPFIIITSYANEDLRTSLRRLEETTLLEKPLDRRQFVACVSATLRSKNPRAPKDMVSSVSSPMRAGQAAVESDCTNHTSVRCVSCSDRWPVCTSFDINQVFFCPRCIEDTGVSSFSELYTDLGGGD